MYNKLVVYNSFSAQKEEFIPIDPNNIKLYVCGPTVYSLPHLGNARSTVVYDLLYRLLKYLYPKVSYVRNITDIDDKIIAAAQQKKISIDQLTTEITKEFHNDMQYLNNLAPNLEPKATENIADIIAMIEKLIANNNAYEVDGHVYFSVKTFDDYGKLSKRIAGLKIGARIEASDLKNNQQDFILWKPSKELEDNSARFASPWGYGRPGWHIECSLMSSKFLGDSFDIHGGGADLKFPHHENEIAQSRSLKPDSYYAKYWVHNGFLTVNGEKMSKSLGNFITVRDLANKNISGFSLRFLLLSTHYRKPLDYSEKAINDAHKKIKFYHSLLEKYPQQQIINEDLDSNFLDPLLDDLNIAKALAYLHKLAKEIELNDTANKIIKFINIIRFLGLDNKGEKIQIPSNIKELVAKISVARLNKDYQEADRLREIIESNGYKLKYSKEGQIEIELI